MLVSKKALSDIRVSPVENEAGRQWTPQFAQTSQSTLSALIAADFEYAAIGDSNLNPIALFQVKRFHYGSGQTDSQAISPL
jgi:hypothetical protein